MRGKCHHLGGVKYRKVPCMTDSTSWWTILSSAPPACRPRKLIPNTVLEGSIQAEDAQKAKSFKSWVVLLLLLPLILRLLAMPWSEDSYTKWKPGKRRGHAGHACAEELPVYVQTEGRPGSCFLVLEWLQSQAQISFSSSSLVKSNQCVDWVVCRFVLFCFCAVLFIQGLKHWKTKEAMRGLQIILLSKGFLVAEAETDT